MGFGNVWVETDPDGSVITVSQLDDAIRLGKAATRERLEGDPAVPDLTGLIEVGSWAAAPKPRKGTARVYVDTAANIAAFGATKREDGRLAFASDTGRLYHVATAAVAEIAYLPLSGGTISGTLVLGAVTLGGTLSRAGDQIIDLTGAATRTLTVQNSTGSQVANLDVDGRVIFRNNTAFTMTIDGTPTANRVMTVPDVASDTFVLVAAAQTLTSKTLTAPSISTPAVSGTMTMTPGVGSQAIVVNTATQTTSQPMFSGAQVWNAGGVTFQAFKINVTRTAWAIGSTFFEVQHGGTGIVKVLDDGAFVLNNLGGVGGVLAFQNTGTTNGFIQIFGGGNDMLMVARNKILLAPGNQSTFGLELSLSGVVKMKLQSSGGVVCADTALGTGSVAGFLYIPSCPGVPSGVPTVETGTIPLVFDSTNDDLYCYRTSWKKVHLA